MKRGEIVDNFVVPPHPKGVVIEDQIVRLEPLNIERHAQDLFSSNQIDHEGKNWAYLPYGPFDTIEAYIQWLELSTTNDDPNFFAIIRKSDQKAVGVASFLRINPQEGLIEVGHINFSPLLQNTKEGTIAMFLMMKWAFDNGYRRYEWKCNALNLKSRYAAQRLGFSYEGVFRQMTISKGRNRDTAWFAAIDKEWPLLRRCFDEYLSHENFGEDGVPIKSLSSLTKPILYKIDDLDLS